MYGCGEAHLVLELWGGGVLVRDVQGSRDGSRGRSPLP